MFIVVRFDSERDLVVLGQAAIKEDARAIMVKDFTEWFWQKVDTSEYSSFEEAYEDYKEDECEITEDAAWLNECHHIDFDWVIIDTGNPEVLTAPLSMKQIVLSTTDDNAYIQGNIVVGLNEIIGLDLDAFLDMLSEKLSGSPLLMDIRCHVIGATNDGSIILHVSGDASEMVELSDDDMEVLKRNLFMEGIDVLSDFLGTELSGNEDKDTIDSMLNEVIDQMPDEELIMFFRRYVVN